LLLSAGISAALSVGARLPFGSTQNYQPSLQQEFARDVGQNLNSSAQEIVKRELRRNPTITAVHAYPVTVSFAKNISFMSDPIEVSK
jgi:hypothetical protein